MYIKIGCSMSQLMRPISCDMEHPIFNLISRDIICRTFAIVTSTTCFNDLGLNGLDFEHPTLLMWSEGFNQLRNRTGVKII